MKQNCASVSVIGIIQCAMKNHHIYARHEIKLDESLEIQCIGKDEGLDVTSLSASISVLSLHLSTPLPHDMQLKVKWTVKNLINTSWQRVGFMPTLVGRAGAVLGFSGSAKISACWKHQLYAVISFCWVLPVRKQMLTSNVLYFDTIQEGMFFGEKERRKLSG